VQESSWSRESIFGNAKSTVGKKSSGKITEKLQNGQQRVEGTGHDQPICLGSRLLKGSSCGFVNPSWMAISGILFLPHLGVGVVPITICRYGAKNV